MHASRCTKYGDARAKQSDVRQVWAGGTNDAEKAHCNDRARERGGCGYVSSSKGGVRCARRERERPQRSLPSLRYTAIASLLPSTSAAVHVLCSGVFSSFISTLTGSKEHCAIEGATKYPLGTLGTAKQRQRELSKCPLGETRVHTPAKNKL
jgi:hypothetical protein